MSAPVGLRPHAPGDEELLLRIYASTRAEELALVPWTASQKEAFLRMQFEAQHAHYTRYYPGAQLQLVLEGDEPLGRLYVHRAASEIRVMDIALLPEHRGRGVGTRLLGELAAEADARSLPLSIHVEQNNPALRLYERLGFRNAGGTFPYLLLVRPPQTTVS